MLLPILSALFIIVVGFVIYANWPQTQVEKQEAQQSQCPMCGAPKGTCAHASQGISPSSYCDQCGQPKAQCGCPQTQCKQCGQPKAQCACPQTDCKQCGQPKAQCACPSKCAFC